MGKCIEGGENFMTELKTKLEVLINIYNEQLEALTRCQIDADFLSALVIAEPNDDELIQQKTKNETALKRKTKLIEVLKKMIEAEGGKVV